MVASLRVASLSRISTSPICFSLAARNSCIGSNSVAVSNTTGALGRALASLATTRVPDTGLPEPVSSVACGTTALATVSVIGALSF